MQWQLDEGSFFFDEGTKYPKYFIATKKQGEESFRHILPPAKKFYADPILFKHEKTNYLFFEDYDYRKGIISCMALDTEISEPKKALELPIHLSFPHLFHDEGTIYMTPETIHYGAVFLFKAVQFPHKWEPVRFLVRGYAFSDPVVFKHEGYYWLFTSIYKEQLFIFYAKKLTDSFLPHPINTQFVQGRNAGPVFFKEGKLIRPTMDCSISYGKRMVLKEIVQLNPTSFIEKEIESIEPTWAPHLDGTHTYCQNEDYLVYDGHRNIFPSEDLLYSS
jgi:hypothetical protein